MWHLRAHTRADAVNVRNIFTAIAIASAGAALSGCSHDSTSGVRFLNGGAPSKPQAQAIQNLSGSSINSAIAGKTFQYTRPDGNGFITYSANGTFTFQDDAKGAGQGTWAVSGGQFCETFKGSAQDCGVFKSTGDAYFAAQSRLVEMKS